MPLWLPFSSPKLVKVSGFTMDIPPGNLFEAPFSREDIDRGGFFSPADPTQITIPSLLGGWYILLCTIRWTLPVEVQVSIQPDPAVEMHYYFYSYVSRNGVVFANDARQTANRTTEAAGTWQVMAMETALAAGDQLKLVISHCFDPAYISRIDAEYHLSLRRIDGVKVSTPRVPSGLVREDEPVPARVSEGGSAAREERGSSAAAEA